MSRAVFLFALLAASASAQVAPPRAPTGGERALLVAGALAGGVAALPTGPFLIVGAGVGTYAASELLGLGPTVGGVLLDTAVGVGVAAAASGVVGYTLVHVAGYPSEFGTDITALFTGLFVGSAAIGVAHGARLAWLRADDVRVAPAALAVPGGRPSPGLTLSVTF